MEKPSRAKATKILSFLRKTTSFSISHPLLSPSREKSSKPKAFHNKAISGSIMSIVPVEAQRKEKNGGSFDAPEPTSPKVSCMGRVKHKKICRSKRSSAAQQERKRPTVIIRKMFRRKLRPSRRTDAAESSEGKPVMAGGTPSLGQMKRFTSGRETLRIIDWMKAERMQEGGTGDREESYPDEEISDEELYHSAPIVMGGGVVALEPRKEVNLWKRRTLAPPVPLQLN